MPSSVCASPSLRLFLTIYTVIQKLDVLVNYVFFLSKNKKYFLAQWRAEL